MVHNAARARYVTAFAAISAFVFAAGCGGANSGKGHAAADSISIRLGGAWATLNPQVTPKDFQIPYAIYDRLVSLGPDDKIKPYLATSWKVTPGSVTFTLRKGAKCSDGTPVTPAVVAGSLRSVFDPKTKSAAAGPFGPPPHRVTADTAANTVTLKLSKPLTDVMYNFTLPAMGIICPAGLKAGADFNKHSYGSGPYTLTSEVQGDHAVLTRRDEWSWGPNGTKAADLPKQITFKVVNDDSTAANLLLSGGLDVGFVSGPNAARLKSLQSESYTTPMAATLYLNQTAGKPGADPRVREALFTAIDRGAWIQAAMGGDGVPDTSFMNSRVACFDPATKDLVPKFDMARAAALLKEAGYVRGSDGKLTKDGKPLTIVIAGSTEQLKGPEYMASQWSQLGVNTKLLNTDPATLTVNFVAGNFDATVSFNNNPIPDPAQTIRFYLGPVPPDGNNLARTNDPAAQAAVEQALTAGDEQQRCAAWSEMQRLTLKNHDLLPLASGRTSWFSRGWRFQPGARGFLDVTTLRRGQA